MFNFVVNSYNTIMDSEINPLSKIPDNGVRHVVMQILAWMWCCLLYTSPSPRDRTRSRMPSSA